MLFSILFNEYLLFDMRTLYKQKEVNPQTRFSYLQFFIIRENEIKNEFQNALGMNIKTYRQ